MEIVGIPWEKLIFFTANIFDIYQDKDFMPSRIGPWKFPRDKIEPQIEIKHNVYKKILY